jgi:hypothetical protein
MREIWWHKKNLEVSEKAVKIYLSSIYLMEIPMFHFFKGQHRFHPHMHGHGHHRGGGGRGPKMFDSGAMRYVVLQLISEKPRHGYEIIKELEQRTGGSYTPSPGAIYPLM